MLRSSLSLAICTQEPFRITNIRANRDKPGLLRQHLTAVNAAAEICNGELVGAQIGSQELTFNPRWPKGGNYSFAIGTAGSSTLVLQTVLPPLLARAEEPSVVRITVELTTAVRRRSTFCSGRSCRSSHGWGPK